VRDLRRARRVERDAVDAQLELGREHRFEEGERALDLRLQGRGTAHHEPAALVDPQAALLVLELVSEELAHEVGQPIGVEVDVLLEVFVRPPQARVGDERPALGPVDAHLEGRQVVGAELALGRRRRIVGGREQEGREQGRDREREPDLDHGGEPRVRVVARAPPPRRPGGRARRRSA
jgi:hypothetical protein